MTHLRSIERRDRDDGGHGDNASFPFSVAAIRTLERLDLDADVVFFVGENGSGKSTLLEAIAAAAVLPTVGAEEVAGDATLAHQRSLAAVFRLIWHRRARRGFFLRAEDFFGFVKRMQQLRAELNARLAEIEIEFRDASPYARGLAAGPVRNSLAEMTSRYGTDLDSNSHGETFLELFRARFVPGGLYLLDEPEAALSPQSQLGLLAMLADMVPRNSQFIIATHFPILLAYPGARIYDFDDPPIHPARWEDLEHVALTRSFLTDPARYLRHLFGTSDPPG